MAMDTLNAKIQLRRGTASDWSTTNPVLLGGEIGIETDSGKFKIGDGSAHWSQLSYFVNVDSMTPGVSVNGGAILVAYHLPVDFFTLGGVPIDSNTIYSPLSSTNPVGMTLLLSSQTDSSFNDVWEHTGGGTFIRVTPSLVSEDFVGGLIAVSGNIITDAPEVLRLTSAGVVEVLPVSVSEITTLITNQTSGLSSSIENDIKERLPLDLKADFGAVGDGITDDTGSFEDATAALMSGPKKHLFIPPGTYKIRRTFKVPSGVTISGVYGQSKITRDPGIKTTLTSDAPSGTATIEVLDSSLFAVGDDVIVSDLGNIEWESTHATITVIDSSTNEITLSSPLISSYTTAASATLYRSFSILANNPHHGNSVIASHSNICISDLVIDQNSSTLDAVNDFTNSAIHLENVYQTKIKNCIVLNAATDAISNQGRLINTPGVGVDHDNTITDCIIKNAKRHGVHLGSTIRGIKVVNNSISDIGHMALFLCANAQNVVFSNNVITNCTQGVGGADTRQPDGSSVDSSTPYDSIKGDIAVCVSGNTFIGGTKSDSTTAVPAITLAAQSVAVGNTIQYWNGGIQITQSSVDCVIHGNTISFSPTVASRSGIEVQLGADRCIISDNVIRGGGFSSGGTKNEVGLNIESANDCIVSGNVFVAVDTAASLSGSINNLSFIDSKFIDIRNGYGAIRIYGALTDSNIDLSGFNSGSGLTPAAYSFHDGLGYAAQTRLRFNGVGNNGSTNPAVGGAWHSSEVNKLYSGVIVHWNDGVEHVSMLVGSTWVELSNTTNTQISGSPKLPSNSTRDWVIPGNLLLSGMVWTPSTNRPVFSIIHVSSPTNFDALGFEINTAGTAGGLGRIAIYTVDSYWQPDALVWQSSAIPLDPSIVPTIVSTPGPGLLAPGLYMVISIFSSGPQLRVHNGGIPGSLGAIASIGGYTRNMTTITNRPSYISSGFPSLAATDSLYWDRDSVGALSTSQLCVVRFREAV